MNTPLYFTTLPELVHMMLELVLMMPELVLRTYDARVGTYDARVHAHTMPELDEISARTRVIICELGHPVANSGKHR